VLGFNLVVLGVYKVEEIIKEEFVTNAVQVKCNVTISTLLVMQQWLQVQ
jgi:hypothetical protein